MYYKPQDQFMSGNISSNDFHPIKKNRKGPNRA